MSADPKTANRKGQGENYSAVRVFLSLSDAVRRDQKYSLISVLTKY
jgi:hypothetical protein